MDRVWAALLLVSIWAGASARGAVDAAVRLVLEDASPRVAYKPLVPIAISPDGRTVAYVGWSADRPPYISSIYLKPVDGGAAARLEITNFGGAIDRVAFSPDGRSLAFSSGGTFRRVAVSGGAASDICVCAPGFNQTPRFSWDANDQIIFSRDYAVLRVPAAGGYPVTLLTPRIEQMVFANAFRVELLPEANAVVFTTAAPAADAIDFYQNTRIVTQPRLGGTERVVVEHGNDPHYIPSLRQLVYAYDGKLFAAPFDPQSVRTAGPAREIADDVRAGPGQFAVAANGTVAYVRGRMFRSEFSLVSRDGTRKPLGVVSGTSPRVSPDGKHIAYSDGRDVWVADLDGLSSPRRLTSEGANRDPIWMSSGERIAYVSKLRLGDADMLYSRRADGGDAPALVARYVEQAEWWSAAKRLWFFRRLGDSWSEWIHNPADGRSKLAAYIAQSYLPASTLSPDGRWLAAERSVTYGHSEIFVAAFPGHDAPIQATHQGGRRPVWSPDGRELFFDDGEHVFVAAVRSGTTPRSRTLEFDEPVALPIREVHRIADRREYDVMPDGTSFLVASNGRVEVEIVKGRLQ